MMEKNEIIIPKVIHYCWFGRNPKSSLIKKCIKSWKEKCLDYEIVEWNETNFDINCCEYVKQAYEQKKWAYVSDYARFYILNKYGGIYVDTDVQFLKPLDELLTTKFAGFAHDDIVNTGLIMATTPNDWLCDAVLKSYEGEQFVWDDPTKILAIGRRVTKILADNGLQLTGEKQEVNDYIIYPEYYFNPTRGDMHVKVDKRAYSVHHYAATWFPKKARIRNTIRRFLGHRIMDKYYSCLSVIKSKK